MRLDFSIAQIVREPDRFIGDKIEISATVLVAQVDGDELYMSCEAARISETFPATERDYKRGGLIVLRAARDKLRALHEAHIRAHD
ncbi:MULTISPECIES: hypothetical protein [unclassified Methylobacterium]|jgi:hypothetical protein|uniref:hypothetical protein n=1 Tax=unclassified Methylobacterium TaxID=2615210 RepID=UPI001355E149|nr:hypothetical protein [Methylobacterium sp. 2A]MWV22440.1 hypothetical protein [Methylobacterium sp. 2A]